MLRQDGDAESFRFLCLGGTIQVSFMERKACIFILVALLCGSIHAADERIPLPDGAGSFLAAPGWRRLPISDVVLSGPVKGAAMAPRIAVAVAAGTPAATAASLRDGWSRVADGCEFIDDDELPLGGRVWRRIRMRFGAGPLTFGQNAWIGSVAGRTVVVILSGPDDSIGAHQGSAAAMVGSISAPR